MVSGGYSATDASFRFSSSGLGNGCRGGTGGAGAASKTSAGSSLGNCCACSSAFQPLIEGRALDREYRPGVRRSSGSTCFVAVSPSGSCVRPISGCPSGVRASAWSSSRTVDPDVPDASQTQESLPSCWGRGTKPSLAPSFRVEISVTTSSLVASTSTHLAEFTNVLIVEDVVQCHRT
jgi:hypothetical protein